MPDNKEPTVPISIRYMPSALWWDARVRAAEERISVAALAIKALRLYLDNSKEE